ncbi:MAG: carbohydrate binding family 9 domain-containing protein, partial [Cyclobacteriaceae bacterium]|nr:carbohydrate binding family 9 domain-containing protein [Cyclobacteriaceae bacterium]
MKLSLLSAFLLISFFGYAQKNVAGIEFLVKKAGDAIKIDGELTEESWKASQQGKDFWVARPIDSIAPANPTFFYITFDDEFLYVGFECMSEARAPIVESLRRDFDYGPNDNVGIYLNTYNDFTNGFYFNITPYGVQREGTVANSGISDDDYSSFWDNKWYSAVKRYDDRWVAEMAIPFKSIRYNIGEWNFNVLRNDVARNQVSSWIATPVQYMPASFQNTGRIIWEQPLPKPGMNISLIPYLTTEGNKAAQETAKYAVNAGFD